MRSDAIFVADTSAWWRAITLPSDLSELVQEAIRDDRMLITPIVRMEILYSARTRAEYALLEAELDALRILRNDRAVADAAFSAVRELAARGDGYHRVQARPVWPQGVIVERPNRSRTGKTTLDGPGGDSGRHLGWRV